MSKTKTKTEEKKLKPILLNSKEYAVLDAFPGPVAGEPTWVTLSDLAGKAFNKRGTSPATKGNSWVRNSMRKLLKLGLVKHKPGRTGTYTRSKYMTKVALAEFLKKAE